MRYDLQEVDNIFNGIAKGVDHTKVSLDSYIGRNAGVCRHQALFAGVLIEKFVSDGTLTGRVSVDRNKVRRADSSDWYDGHAWVRYTNRKGKVYIIDIAQKKAGALSDLMEARGRGDRVWAYARPEDRQTEMGGRALGETGIGPRYDGLKFDDQGMVVIPDWFKKHP